MSEEDAKPHDAHEPMRAAPTTLAVKLYTLKTPAPYRIAREVAVAIAQRFGYVALLSEVPDDEIVIVRRPIWGATRWLLVIGILAAAPFFFGHIWKSANALQGFGVGFITAVIVLLARRNEREL